jgi:hypothetical protein
MDTVEKFYILSETRDSNLINDKNTITLNAIFDVISSHDPLLNAHWTVVHPEIQAINIHLLQPAQTHHTAPKT